ncbi:MAG: hypothetical protein ACKOA8_18065 [Deltaproteobacteria bacterium]
MVRCLLTVSVFLFFTGCGKNDLGVYGTRPGFSNSPITQAPPPRAPMYPPQNNVPPPMFNPQVPQAMPPQFYPWMPMYNFFIQHPPIQYVWFNIWSRWQIYAASYGCGVYNFPIFWNLYFPTIWNYGPYVQLFQFMSTNFYSWMGPGVALPQTANANFFWGNYLGTPIGGFGFGGMGGW